MMLKGRFTRTMFARDDATQQESGELATGTTS